MRNMMKYLSMLAMVAVLASCGDDDDDDDLGPDTPDAGTISGGPFTFVVDGTPDMVSGITTDENAVGEKSTFVITDDAGEILGLPPTLTDLEGVDFDGAGPGICLIWYLRYDGEITGLAVGENANDLAGSFDLSNSITVTRNGPSAGMISGAPFAFIVDGTADNVSGITVTDNVDVGNTGYVITDDQNNILGLPPTMEALEGVDFDGAGTGVCLIWRIVYEDGLQGLTAGENVDDLMGTYSLSNSISVTRGSVGTLSGGPFVFAVDGTIDNVSGVMVADNFDLTNTTYVVTDDANNILGLPPTVTDLEGVDFDAAGAGICLIWRLTHEDDITGLAVGENAGDLGGTFDLSNSITVTRGSAGTIAGGPFTFTVDGTPDNVSGITTSGNVDLANTTYVITDDAGVILGLPPGMTELEGVDFDAAGVGVCLIWRLTYEDGITGLSQGNNASDLSGTFSLSNSITVTRN